MRSLPKLLVAVAAACYLSVTVPHPPLAQSIEEEPATGQALLVPMAGMVPPVGELWPGVHVSASHVYYSLDGRTLADLRHQMAERGPTDGSSRWSALTSWNLRWSYPYQHHRDAGCEAESVSVEVAVTYTFPAWRPSADAEEELVQRWEKFMAALVEHEYGHGRLAAQAGLELQQELVDLPRAPSCSEFDQVAHAAAARVAARHNQLQVEYDDTTGHGAAQGAHLD